MLVLLQQRFHPNRSDIQAKSRRNSEYMSSDIPYLTQLSLKQRVLKSGAWSFAGHCLSQAIRFGSNLIMTRLLAPDAFALMAIATVVMIGLNMFSDLGLRPIVVRNHSWK